MVPTPAQSTDPFLNIPWNNLSVSWLTTCLHACSHAHFPFATHLASIPQLFPPFSELGSAHRPVSNIINPHNEPFLLGPRTVSFFPRLLQALFTFFTLFIRMDIAISPISPSNCVSLTLTLIFISSVTEWIVCDQKFISWISNPQYDWLGDKAFKQVINVTWGHKDGPSPTWLDLKRSEFTETY